MKRSIWLAGTCGLASCVWLPAQAQSADGELPDEAVEESSNVIIVTATRREESLQEVPVAVTAISGEVLDNAGIGSVEALTAIAPSVTFTQSSNDQNNSINIRGVGTSVFSQGVESSVSVVVDDVVMARQAMGFQDLADVQRVEVLRGPQSTLFGKNASAGVISVTTQAPTSNFSGMIDGQVAEGGEYALRASLSGPLGGDFSGRLTGYYKEFDGQIENLSDGRDLNGYQNWGLRGKILFQPGNGDSSFTLIGDYRKSEQDCCIYVARDTSNASGAIGGGRIDDLLNPVVAGRENAQSNVNAPVFNNSEQWGVSGKADLDVGGGYTLTSISAYRWYDFVNNIDVDLLDLEDPELGIITFDLNSGTTKITQLSQEVRLTSPQGPPFDFVLGGFAFLLDIDRTFQRRFEILLPLFGGFQINQSGQFDAAVSTQNLALFGSANVYLTDDTVVFGGARLINETLDYRVNRDPADVLVPGDRPFGGNPGTFLALVDQTEDTAVTGDIGIRHAFGPDVNAYARYARGYKGRGIDSGFGAPQGVEPIEAETSDAFELGLKSSLLNDDLIINLALFHTDFENFQEQAAVLVTDPNNLLSAETRLTNVGSVRTRGVEVDAIFTPTDSFFIQAGVAYTDASITEFENASCYFQQTAAEGCVPVTLDDGGTPGDPSDDIVQNLQDLSGSDLPNAPEWRVTGLVRKEFPIAAAFNPFVQVSGRWQSSLNYSLDGDPRADQSGYAIVNIAVGIEADDGSYSVSVFANNVFDEFYATNIFGDPLFGNSGVVSQYVPRDFSRYFGARARFSF
ncbi:TonB-dependent receptor [Erythrobacter sp. KY5]|uniref:TonB-dependent receptor n=1 Tax=Erythrobacter sp. KY5 TaxID=2011159 RepID=UPI0013A6F710|nr:TonB-dependent receptor [Erythrobacter sp. KY5]